MTGIGLVNLIYAKQLLDWSILASVMINEITSSYDDHLSAELNAVKHHKGQQQVAETMRKWIAGSKAVRKRETELFCKQTEQTFNHKIQPYYSLRCVPQILGPVRDALTNAEKVLVNELNSACDNPIVDEETKNVYHGGNFHGDYVSFEMDKLKIAVTKLTMLAERQLNYLLHDRINGILPPFVNLGTLGLNYGLQAAQFTATSTTAECQTLSNPMYVHSIPNNNDNQDIVSMGFNSACTTRRVIENTFEVLAIEAEAILQGIDQLHALENLSPAAQKIYVALREQFPVVLEDRPTGRETEQVKKYLKNNPQNSLF